jgi:hypothetical protein
MKTIIRTLSIAACLMIWGLLNSFTSTEHRPTGLQEQLLGHWTIQSFKLDGLELKSNLVANSSLQLNIISAEQGSFHWEIVYQDGTREHNVGTYQINEQKSQLTLQSAKGDRLNFEVQVKDHSMNLKGTLDYERYEIVAKKD